MKDDTETLFELMLAADRFCSAVNSKLQDRSNSGREELRLKLGQCISTVQRLRELYESDQLTVTSAVVRAEIRQLILALMWASFYARDIIDRKTFRLLVMIEAAFSYLLSSGDFGVSVTP
jgi:hypothetical protein